MSVVSSEPWHAYAAGSEVDHFAEFARTHLRHSDDRWEGQPFELEDWQRRMLGEALAFDENGWPVWRSVVIVAPRKQGKTALQAAVALYRLLTNSGRPEILLAASSDKQAGRLFDACARFVRRSGELSSLLRVRDHAGEIAREDGMGVILRLSSDPARLHGYGPTEVVADELAQWVTPQLQRAYAALTSGGGARSAPQSFSITTAGEASQRHSSILGRILDAAEEAEDVERTPGLMVARMPDSQTLVYSWSAPTTDPRDTAAMKLANPASWITEEYLAKQAANPELTDAQVLQLHACVWAATSTTWIPPDTWAAAADRSRELQPGEEVYLGFDGSERRDATALVACSADGFVQPLKVWQRPDGAGDDWRIPRREVHDAVGAAFETFEVRELACDPSGWWAELDAWAERYPARVVEHTTQRPQKFSAACDRFRTGVLERTLTHNGDPVLAAHVGNAVARETPWGTVIAKDHADSPRKIDAAVAAVLAHDRACVAEPIAAPWIGWLP